MSSRRALGEPRELLDEFIQMTAHRSRAISTEFAIFEIEIYVREWVKRKVAHLSKSVLRSISDSREAPSEELTAGARTKYFRRSPLGGVRSHMIP